MNKLPEIFSGYAFRPECHTPQNLNPGLIRNALS